MSSLPTASERPISPAVPPCPSTHPGKLLETGPSPHSGHKLDAFIRCPQHWAFKYGPGAASGLIRRREDIDRYGALNARSKGTLGHIGLAHFFRRAMAEQAGQDPEEFLPWPDAIAVKAWKQDCESGGFAWAEFVPTAQTTVGAWLTHRVQVQQLRLRVLGVEAVIDLSPLYGFPLTRSVDLIAQEDDGKVYFWDHKFTALPITSTVTARYAIDGQFLDYQAFGPAAYQEHWGGARANLIQWPHNGKVNMDMGRAPPAPAAVAARPETARRAYQEMAWLALQGTDLWKYPKRLSELVCVTPYGLCGAYDLCAHGPEAVRFASWPASAD